MANTVLPKGKPTTITVTASVALNCYELAEVDPTDGQLDAIAAANPGRQVVTMADVAAGEDVSVAIGGVFTMSNGSGGTLEIGDKVAAKDAESVDAGTAGDAYLGTVVGPLSSNADGAEVWVDIEDGPGLGAVA